LRAIRNAILNIPKYQKVVEYIVDKNWLEFGCIVFSQYFDSIWWLANQLSGDFPDEPIGIYAGGNNSGVILSGDYKKVSRDDLKQKVGKGELRLLLGTDAASEGLNLQRLGTLINLDLPWNPTRLEQRKGPDILEDVWIDVANGKIENAKKLIDSVKPKHPFDERYNQITEIDWDSCSNVLNADEKRKILLDEW
jgi:hypothetical protein